MLSDWRAIAALVVGGLVVYTLAKREAAAVLHAVSPTNSENIFYSGVNDVGAAIADDPDWSLGVAIYEWFHE